MTDAAKPSTITAAILVIGDEILSGRTKDKNIGYIAEYLTNIGIDVKEVRVVPDEEPEVVTALDALRHRYTYVFTTGGIGPTHDDITADCVAKAFGVTIDVDPRARALLLTRIAEKDLNEARLRMARIPAGADLILNKVSAAPGFRIGNVHVMAGVPSIMQAMLDEVAPTLKTGVKMLSETVRAELREGDIGTPLGGRRQGASGGDDRQLSVPGRPRAQQQHRGALARSGQARRRQGRGRGHARQRPRRPAAERLRRDAAAPDPAPIFARDRHARRRGIERRRDRRRS